MLITVTTLSGDKLIPLDVSQDLDLKAFKELCSTETGIRANEMVLIYEGRNLNDDSKPLSFYKLKEGDVILAERKQPAANLSAPVPKTGTSTGGLLDFSTIRIPGQPMSTGSTSSSSNARNPKDDPAMIRSMFLSNPEQLALLRHNNPQLADALSKGLDEFKKVFEEQKRVKQEQDRLQLRLLQADPFDAEAQRLIQEEINRQNIASNMEAAMEYHPESFGSVTMLYINCKVNGHPVKAFIDSGAQSTIMSSGCAARCNVTRLIDTRWSGIAKGVGTQKIIGRIHLGQIQIEGDFLASSFIILEGQEMDFLLGLDMLKRHQCCIDLKENILLIGTTGTKTRFLSENEIPKLDKFS